MKKLSILLAAFAFSIGFGQDFGTVRDIVGNAVPNVTIAPDGTNADCSQETLSNNFENGHGNLHLLTVANDFSVGANEVFAINQFKFNVILPAGFTVAAADIYFYQDSGAGPGEQLDAITFAEPTSQTTVGNLSTFDVNEVTFDLDAVTMEGGESGATYWIGVMIYTDAANSYWEGTSVIDTENEGYLFLDGAWAPISTTFASAPFDGVFEISGDCSTMGVSDLNSNSISIYPNPVRDILNISAKNSDVKEVSVTNLNGQVVATAKTSSVNVSTLPAGVYVVKVVDAKGNVSTSKIVKK